METGRSCIGRGAFASVLPLPLVLAAACAKAAPPSPEKAQASASAVVNTVPTGVPVAVFAAARGIRDTPGNRITEPVEWIRTTFTAWEKVADPGSAGTRTAERAPVYVVQVQGTFVNSFSHTGTTTLPSQTPAPLTVMGAIVPIGPPVPGANGGYGGTRPIDLAKIAPVHTFVMP